MPPAARVGDPTGHPGVIGPPGVPTVLIGGVPAATVGSMHTCAFPPPAFIGGLPAARMGDLAGCGAPIIAGAPNVLIGG
jgi:uncharacterized Zn-binding protein involved in type VI secretion